MYIENLAIGVDCAPQPMILATDQDNNVDQMLFVVGTGMSAPDAIRDMLTKSIDPQPGGLPADNHAPLSAKRRYVQTA